MGLLQRLFFNEQQSQQQPQQQSLVQGILASRFPQPQQQAQQNTPDLLNAINQGLQPTDQDIGNVAWARVAQKNPALTAESVAQSRFAPQLGILKEISEVNRNNALAANGGNRGGAIDAAAMKIMQENPGTSYTQAYNIAKSGLGQGNTLIDGRVENLPGAPEAAGNIKFSERKGAKGGDIVAEREGAYTKAQSALQGFKQQSALVNYTIDKTLGLIKNSRTATGWGNVAFSGLPNTDARALNNYLSTIKANVGFDKLQNMRENSPTGGALGQISDFENKLLQAVNGTLDPLQSDKLAENLTIIKSLYPQVMAERERAFQQDYSGYSPLNGNQSVTQPAPINMGGKRINIITPDGKPGTIDAAHVDDLLQAGGRLVQ